ncbi:MAG: YigZ family protein [Sphaerochaetaceae bacterium]|nr:YigZ family protein [Sphaerochaetaceae bacterium]
MRILKEEKQVELIVKKSRFVAVAKICNNISEVKTITEEIRSLHPGANHVVHAAVVGNQFSFSDDHEPKNTAGRPAFEVLKGSGITNIIILIVRYFGGTLLGTGGLVKAYGDSAKLVLENIETEELVEKSSFSFSIPYDLYESTKHILTELQSSEIKEDFGTVIEISGKLPKDNKESLVQKIMNLSNGKVHIQ